MKFVLVTFIYVITVQYASTLPYAIYYPPPFYNSYRYTQPTSFRFMQPPTSAYSTSYRYLIPENSRLVLPNKPALNSEQSRSHLESLLLRMKLSMMEMTNNQERSGTDQSSKAIANPNAKTYKGKTTKKTLASFRSASV